MWSCGINRNYSSLKNGHLHLSLQFSHFHPASLISTNCHLRCLFDSFCASCCHRLPHPHFLKTSLSFAIVWVPVSAKRWSLRGSWLVPGNGFWTVFSLWFVLKNVQYKAGSGWLGLSVQICIWASEPSSPPDVTRHNSFESTLVLMVFVIKSIPSTKTRNA